LLITEHTKRGVAPRAETAALAIGFVAVVAGKRFVTSPLQFMRIKLTANVAAGSAILRISIQRSLKRCTNTISSVRCIILLGGVLLVPPSAATRAFENRVTAVRKFN
jgi:hypothetical protein